MTLDDLAPFCDRAKLSAHLAQLKLWHFIEKPDAAHYRITEHGKNFVNGFVRVPEAVYTVSGALVERPEDMEAPRCLFAWELAPTELKKANCGERNVAAAISRHLGAT